MLRAAENCCPIGLPFINLILSFQKVISSLTEGVKSKLTSQLVPRTITVLRNLVMRLVTFPTARLREFSLPATAQSYPAVEWPVSKIETKLGKTRLIFFPGTTSRSSHRSIVNPNQIDSEPQPVNDRGGDPKGLLRNRTKTRLNRIPCNFRATIPSNRLI